MANRLKERLLRQERLIGMWLSMGSPLAAEMAAHAGFDWCLIDGEHGPNDFITIQQQLMAADHATDCIVRVPANEAWIIKKVLDLGARTVMVPMVSTAEEAHAAVAACRYAPEGVRGMAASLVRASRYGLEGDYVARANGEIAVIVQVETRRALKNLDAIIATEGVDGVFLGPADLSAELGFPGRPDHPQAEAVFRETIARVRAAGKSAGTIFYDAGDIARAFEWGANFVAVGVDVGLLAGAMRGAARTYRT
ncbi:HpcH/HpaI aldolase family protein [Xanthobacter sediminis]